MQESFLVLVWVSLFEFSSGAFPSECDLANVGITEPYYQLYYIIYFYFWTRTFIVHTYITYLHLHLWCSLLFQLIHNINIDYWLIKQFFQNHQRNRTLTCNNFFFINRIRKIIKLHASLKISTLYLRKIWANALMLHVKYTFYHMPVAFIFLLYLLHLYYDIP